MVLVTAAATNERYGQWLRARAYIHKQTGPNDRRNLVAVVEVFPKSLFPLARLCNNNNKLDALGNRQQPRVRESVQEVVAEAAKELMQMWVWGWSEDL